jgi:hypothetical protein
MTNEPRAHLDDRRRAIYEALALKDSAIAGLYSSAIRFLVQPPAEGEERARVACIGHAMRELMNALPGVLGDSDSRGARREANVRLRKLIELLRRSPDLDLGQDLDYVPVPRDIARALDSYSKQQALETRRVLEDAATLLTGGENLQHPLRGQWNSTRDEFTGWAHVGRDASERPLPSDAQMEAAILVIEEVIEVRTAEFFDSRHALEDLLSELNGAADGSR